MNTNRTRPPRCPIIWPLARRAVIYCRVSTVEQTQNLSLPTQEKACRTYAASHGYDVDHVFVDAGESAKTTDRPEFRRLLSQCREEKGKVHAVIVYSLTRFSRNSADHHAIQTPLRGLGIMLRSVTEPIDESPSGRLMEGILASMAQFDNDVRAERVTAGMKAAVERGRWVWLAPMGYVNGDTSRGPSLIPDPARAPAVREAFALCAGGVRGRPLLQRLTAMGLVSRRGNPLSLNRLYELLRHPVYIGQVRAKDWGADTLGDFEPLVTEEVFGRVQAQLMIHARSAPARRIVRHVNHPDFPLRRFSRCATCDKPLTGSKSAGRSQRYAFYHCKAGCTRVATSVLEAQFLQLLDALKPRPAYWKLLKASILDVWTESKRDRAAARVAAQRHVTTLGTQLEHLERRFIFDGAIDQASYATQRDRLREEIAVAKMELSDTAAREDSLEADLAFAEHALFHASALWTNAHTVEDRIKTQWAMFPQGLIVNSRAGSTSRSGSPLVEPQIRAVSCLEFFELAERDAPRRKVVDRTGIEPLIS